MRGATDVRHAALAPRFAQRSVYSRELRANVTAYNFSTDVTRRCHGSHPGDPIPRLLPKLVRR
jgi:hypothetical protein